MYVKKNRESRCGGMKPQSTQTYADNQNKHRETERVHKNNSKSALLKALRCHIRMESRLRSLKKKLSSQHVIWQRCGRVCPLHLFNSVLRLQNNSGHWLTSDKGAPTPAEDPQTIRESENEKQFC